MGGARFRRRADPKPASTKQHKTAQNSTNSAAGGRSRAIPTNGCSRVHQRLRQNYSGRGFVPAALNAGGASIPGGPFGEKLFFGDEASTRAHVGRSAQKFYFTASMCSLSAALLIDRRSRS